MTTIAKLNIHVGATTAELEQKLGKSESTVKNFGASFASLGRVGAVAGMLGAFAGGLTSITSLEDAARSTFDTIVAGIERIDNTSAAADRLGTTGEQLAGLHHAANLAESSAEGVDKGLAKMVRTLGEARGGSEKAAEAFKSLGLDADQLAKEDSVTAFGRIADAISKLPTPADKAAAAVKIFGKEGQGLINLLDEGSAGLEAMAADAEALGLTFDEVDAAKIGEADNAMKRLTAAWEGFSNTLAIAAAPALETVVGWLTSIVQLASTAAGNIAAAIGQFFGDSGPATDKRAQRRELGKAFEDAAAQAEAEVEKVDKQVNKLAELGKRVTEEVRTPMEVFADRVAELEQLVGAGAISWNTYERAVGKALDEMEKATEQKQKFDSLAKTQIGAVTQQSTAGFSAVFGAIAESNRLADVARQQLAEEKRQTQAMKAIEQRLKQPLVEVREARL